MGYFSAIFLFNINAYAPVSSLLYYATYLVVKISPTCETFEASKPDHLKLLLMLLQGG